LIANIEYLCKIEEKVIFMIVVHHLNRSRSHRIIWLLEELGVPYEIKYYERDPKTKLAPASLQKVFPLGKSPIITDGEITLAESGAIIEYILYKYGAGRLKPIEGSKEWVQYLYWLHFAEGSFQPIRILKLAFETMHQKSPFFLKPLTKKIKNQAAKFYDPQINDQLNLIESTLSKSTWITGNEFTAADIQLGISMILSGVYKNDSSQKPHLKAYVENLQQRPAFKRTLEVAGPAEFK
jgi:glutathione S-transferase